MAMLVITSHHGCVGKRSASTLLMPGNVEAQHGSCRDARTHQPHVLGHLGAAIDVANLVMTFTVRHGIDVYRWPIYRWFTY